MVYVVWPRSFSTQIPECQDSLWHLLSNSLGSSFLHPSVLSPHYFALCVLFYFVCRYKCKAYEHMCIRVHAPLCLCAEARGGCQMSCSITLYLSPLR